MGAGSIARLGPLGFTRTVAIKRLQAPLAAEEGSVEAFMDEARIAAHVQHPNVVPTLDCILRGDELFIVLEYVHGASLSQLIRQASSRKERPSARIAAAVMSGALQGLRAAHEARDAQGRALDIVHRDISPQNIMVGVDGLSRILDFGVARAIGRLQETRDGKIKGKLGYMAPEVLLGTPATQQSDIWSLGVVLWEVLTSERLFRGETDAQTVGLVMNGPVPPVASRGSAVPASLEAVIQRALNRDVRERFQTAREMTAALEAALPLATHSEVGEWVERTASLALASRQELITTSSAEPPLCELGGNTETELMPIPSGDPAYGPRATFDGSPPRPISAPGRAKSRADAEPRSFTETGLEIFRSERRRLRVGLALVFVAVVLGLGVLTARSLDDRTPPALQANLPTEAPSALLGVQAVTVDEPRAVVEPLAAEPALEAPKVAPTPSPEAPRAGEGAPPPRRPRAPKQKRAAASTRCDPPYFFDAQGHKRWKVECL